MIGFVCLLAFESILLHTVSLFAAECFREV